MARNDIYLNINSLSVADAVVTGQQDMTAATIPELVLGDTPTFNFYFTDNTNVWPSWAGNSSYSLTWALSDAVSGDFTPAATTGNATPITGGWSVVLPLNSYDLVGLLNSKRVGQPYPVQNLWQQLRVTDPSGNEVTRAMFWTPVRYRAISDTQNTESASPTGGRFVTVNNVNTLTTPTAAQFYAANPVPTSALGTAANGELLIGNGTGFTKATLTAGSGVSITNGSGSITITATDGDITLDDGTAAAPSLKFTADTDTGLFRPSDNVVGISAGGVSRATFGATSAINGTTIPASKTLVVTTDKLSALAATTSAELAGVISDETGTGALVFATSPTLTTPILGTPQSGTLSSCTGLPISTGVSGLGTNVATFLATPSSANLASAVSDETGTGALVFANTPTLVTPNIGAATGTSVNLSGAGTFGGNLTVSGGAASISGGGAVLNLGTNTTTGTRIIQFGSTYNSGTLSFLNGATSVLNISAAGGFDCRLDGSFAGKLTVSGGTSANTNIAALRSNYTGGASAPYVSLFGFADETTGARIVGDVNGAADIGAGLKIQTRTNAGVLQDVISFPKNTNNTTLAGNLTVSGGTTTSGVAKVGTGLVSWAEFSHSGAFGTSNYCLLQNSSGGTYLNAVAGQNVYFAIGNTIHGNLTSTGSFLFGTTTNSGNGRIQLADHTTSAGGIGFGTDFSLYRSGTRTLTLEASSSPTVVISGPANGSTVTLKLGDGVNNDQGVITSTAGDLVFKRNATTALTLDSSQQAKFSSAVYCNTTTQSSGVAGAKLITKQTSGTNDWTVTLDGNPDGVAGASYGLRILAGTNSSDYSLYIRNQTNTTTLLAVKGSGRVNMGALPTSSTGLSAGDIWNDAGTLKIV